MITFDQAGKKVGDYFKRREVLAPVTLHIPADRKIALLGDPEGDKRILVDMLAGSILPSSGHIARTTTTSFAIGKIPSLMPQLSVRVNCAHVARLHGADVRATLDFLERFLRLGDAFDRPYQELPAQARKPFAVILALSLPFDTYVFSDDNMRRMSRSNRRQDGFAAGAAELFEARMQTAGMIVPTRDIGFARENFELALVLHRGRLLLSADFDAIAELQRRRPERGGATRAAQRDKRNTGKKRQRRRRRARGARQDS
jgi:capsular polysaccharide transport system ATP-binding protein